MTSETSDVTAVDVRLGPGCLVLAAMVVVSWVLIGLAIAVAVGAFR